MFALAFPPLDPVFFSVGPVQIRWYALAYLVGFVLAWLQSQKLAALNPKGPSAKEFDDFLTWGVVGTILGGRLGYVLFYQPELYLTEPLEAFKIWHGGMSFHGGILGVIGAGWLFCRKRKIPFFGLFDILACVTPIGLGLGRIANFINGELFGRTTDVPWGVVFPRGGDLPRHPSQIYEALLEGLVFYIAMMILVHRPALRNRTGLLSGLFLLLYAFFRFSVEFFREPDAQLGFLFAGATMGQLLCLPMFIAGGILAFWAWRRKKAV